MRTKKIVIFLGIILLAAACSNKGVRMPKHRKRTHCDCPTFSLLPSPTLSHSSQDYAFAGETDRL